MYTFCGFNSTNCYFDQTLDYRDFTLAVSHLYRYRYYDW